MNYCIGIDVGTSGTKAVLAAAASGQYENVRTVSEAMTPKSLITVSCDKRKTGDYNHIYDVYRRLYKGIEASRQMQNF